MEETAFKRTDIEETMRTAYLSYAMSVITARALPDVRDGLKPVQRRILYAMNDMGLNHDRPTRKSARIVGEVLGKYHPHGDQAVYEAMVRMAQEFSMRYPLVEGQGNFGSVDGDGAAAVRYTEARLSVIGDEMLTDLEKDAVDFSENFDGSLKEPLVLPGKVPNFLVNGVGGIAVGMATNVPPHNLGEIADAIAYLVDHYHEADDVTLDDLMRFVKGPDFPTGGMILGDEGIRQAYATGRGRVVMRSQVHSEEISGGRVALIVTELPYQVNKSTLVGRIAMLAREGRVDGISDLRDESDRMGIRIVIELKRGVEWGPVLAGLLKYSQLQATFGVNMLALVDGEPRTLSLKRALLHYIDHRYTVVERRTRHDLARARQRAHILEGLLIALDHLDEVISTIRRSRTADTAKENLRKKFGFTEVQAQAILDLQLRRLAALERRRVQEEYGEIMQRINRLLELLSSEANIRGMVKEEILDLKRVYGDPRRTRVSNLEVSTDVGAGDLVVDEDLVLVTSAQGRVRQFPISMCHAGEGGLVSCLSTLGDPALALARANAQEKVAFVSRMGKVFALGAHQVPDARQQPDGVTVDGLARLPEGDTIVAIVPLATGQGKDPAMALATAQGRIKRVTLADLNNVGRDATDIIGLVDGDSVAGAALSSAGDELLLVTAQGRSIRIAADDVRPQGLPAMGVKGIELKSGDVVVAIDRVLPGADLMVVTGNGFAKRSALAGYASQNRGGQGIATLDASKAAIAGPIACARVISEEDHLLFATAQGHMQEQVASQVPRTARDSWARVVTRTRNGAAVRLSDGDRVVGCVAIAPGGAKVPAGTGAPASSGTPAAAAAKPAKAASRKASGSRKAATAEAKAPASRSRRAASESTPAAEATVPKPRATRKRAKPEAANDAPAEAKPAATRTRKATASVRTRGASTPEAGSAQPAAPTEKPAARKPRSRRAMEPAVEESKPAPARRRSAAKSPKSPAPSEPEAGTASTASASDETTAGTGKRRTARAVRQSPQRKRSGE